MRSVRLLSSLLALTWVLGAGAALARQVEATRENPPGIEKRDPAAIAGEHLELLEARLSLDPAQASKVGDILLERARRIDPFIGVARDVRQSVEDRKALKKIHDEAEARMFEVFTREQRDAYEVLRREHYESYGVTPPEPKARRAEPGS